MDDIKPEGTTPEARSDNNAGQSNEVKHTEEKKNKDAKNKKEQKKDFRAIFNEYKGEFKKIIWPSRQELIKKTATVIFVSLLFGLLIFGMDSVYNVGVQLFVQLVTK